MVTESSVFEMWYDGIGDVERSDVCVLDDVISKYKYKYKYKYLYFASIFQTKNTS